MKVLLLSPYPPALLAPMHGVVSATNDDLQVNEHEYAKGYYDIIILYGYRKILTADEIAAEKAIINLHISLLPWNRGACPNLFSWYDDTPKGVTIHQVVEKVDAGPILFQREVEFRPVVETLKTSYDKLQTAMVRLFCDYWWRLRRQDLWVGYLPKIEGSFHTTIECNDLLKHFPKGINTLVTDIIKFKNGLAVDTWENEGGR